MSFCCNTGDKSVPIEVVNRHKQQGEWIYENDQRNIGIYETKYESYFYARPALAWIKAFIKTKYDAVNKLLIKDISNKIVELSEKRRELTSEIDKFESNIKALELEVEQAKHSKKDSENSLKQSSKKFEEEIESVNSLIVKLEQDRKKVLTRGMASLQKFDKNRRKFEVVASIAAMLEFPSQLMAIFSSQLSEFISRIESYRNIFEQKDVDLNYLPQREDNEENLNLKDPITGGKIEHVVATSSGTLFDKLSLLKIFDTSQDIILPCVFTRKDGTHEKIEYLDWVEIPDIQMHLDMQQHRKSYSQVLLSLLQKFTNSEIDMTVDHLKGENERLLREIQKMKELYEEKETGLEETYQLLEKLQSVIEIKKISTNSDFSYVTADKIELKPCVEKLNTTEGSKTRSIKATLDARKNTEIVKLISLNNSSCACYEKPHTCNISDCSLNNTCNQKSEPTKMLVNEESLLRNISFNLSCKNSDSLLGSDVKLQNVTRTAVDPLELKQAEDPNSIKTGKSDRIITTLDAKKGYQAEMADIPADKILSLNCLSSNFGNLEDPEQSVSLLGYEVIPQNISNESVDSDFSKECSVSETDNGFESDDSFGQDNSTCISDEARCLFKCPCGGLKTTVTYPCKHYYFCAYVHLIFLSLIIGARFVKKE